MGCCCKKRKEILLIDDQENANKIEFNINKAVKLIKLCLYDDPNYNIFYDKISNYNDIMFEEFFKGNIDYCMKNKDLYYLNEEEEKKFEFLLLKLLDFQTIIWEWYEDESKHQLIKGLWKKKYCIGKLKDKTSEELDEILNEIINENNVSIDNKENIKIELINLISNSPETEASNSVRYLKIHFEDYYSLIEVSKSYKETMEKSKAYEDRVCQTKLKGFIKELISKAKSLISEQINEKLIPKLEKNKAYTYLYEKHIEENINNYGSQAVGIGKLIIKKLIDKFAKGSTLNKIIQTFDNNCINPVFLTIEAAMLFLNVCTSIETFYEHLWDYRQNSTYFQKRLKEIHISFENHKKEIKDINLENVDDAIRKIIDIGKKLNCDKSDLIDLMCEIKREIEAENKGGKESIKGIVGGGIGVASAIFGTIITGGGLALFYGVLAGVNAVLIGINSANLALSIKAAKDYIEVLKQARQEYLSIENELVNLKSLYEKANLDYMPINII
jgi:hypothetical protein